MLSSDDRNVDFFLTEVYVNLHYDICYKFLTVYCGIIFICLSHCLWVAKQFLVCGDIISLIDRRIAPSTLIS